ncbi:hypothetical protein Y032_0006g2906 [Ancylostoma ceylanicum]|uniref:Uncharacterized protein n=1 Tax=Ancylostoma ceylanicum TaxID=53326 RepID=A0A016VQI4_9BILA|nr:hypothetical protein Y032_0006g2906 [Ancylostoma ceylanicum]
MSTIEALNAYVPYTVTCEGGGHPMYQFNASYFHTLWYKSTDPGGLDGWVGHGRDRTINRVPALQAPRGRPQSFGFDFPGSDKGDDAETLAGVKICNNLGPLLKLFKTTVFREYYLDHSVIPS